MSGRLDADVAIVGAGPAGSACAILLARAGLDVLLIDRRPFPRGKPCGDCLSPRAALVLDRLGVLAAVHAARPARLDGWRIFSPGGASFTERFSTVCGGDDRLASAIAIERARLDAILLDHAIRAGARFLAPLHVTGLAGDAKAHMIEGRAGAETEGSVDSEASGSGGPPRARVSIRARLVIGADGLRSVIARRIGVVARLPRRHKFSLTAHLRGLAPAQQGAFGEMHVADGICLGLAPVTAVDPKLWNVTLVADSNRHGRAAAADPLVFFTDSLGRFPALRDRYDAPRFDLQPSGFDTRLLASGPFDRPTRSVVADGVALVGDAAGYFDPFTGQGIYHALAGAERLADAAVRALTAGDTRASRLRDYARAHAAMAGPAHRMQRFLDAILRHPRLADAAIARLGRRPTAARAILAATGDVRPPASLLSPAPLLSFAGPSWIERLL